MRTRARRAPPGCSGHRTRWCGCGDRSPGGGPARAGSAAARAQLTIAQRTVLAQEQLEVRALLVRELEKHLLPLRVLETLAVALEELVRAALTADADEQRLLIVDALAQLFGACGKQAAGGAFEKEERRARFELRVAGREVRVPLLERAEMFALFRGELLKHRAASWILGDRGGARVELESAALGGNGHPQRVSREHAVRRRPVNRRRLLARPALLAGADDLHHRLGGRKVSRRRDLLHQGLDIGAEELRRPMTGRAHEMKVPRMAARRLEARTPVPEVDFAGDACAHHPLERAVDRSAADAGRFAAHLVEEIVGAEMAFLAQEDVQDAIAFG